MTSSTPRVVSLIVLVAVLSCLNSGLYITSRMLFGLAAQGDAPRALVALDKRLVPSRAILIGTVFGYLAVLASVVSPQRLFTFLVNASGAIMLVIYLLIALAQIRQYGDPVLRMRAAEVETFDDELVRITDRMKGLMHDAEGVGLAATQVGILRRFFVATLDGEDRVLVNPVVTPQGDETETDQEGCLSLGPIRLPVERAARVTLEARDEKGEPFTLELEALRSALEETSRIGRE